MQPTNTYNVASKFALGQQVWFIHENRATRGWVKTVAIDARLKPEGPECETVDTKEIYTVERRFRGGQAISRDVCELFESKEALMTQLAEEQ